MAQVLQ
jgi:hypothetical protein